jgi:hypothetical protein
MVACCRKSERISMLTLAFLTGALFGACLGIFLACLLRAGHDADLVAMCLECRWRQVTP